MPLSTVGVEPLGQVGWRAPEALARVLITVRLAGDPPLSLLSENQDQTLQEHGPALVAPGCTVRCIGSDENGPASSCPIPVNVIGERQMPESHAMVRAIIGCPKRRRRRPDVGMTGREIRHKNVEDIEHGRGPGLKT